MWGRMGVGGKERHESGRSCPDLWCGNHDPGLELDHPQRGKWWIAAAASGVPVKIDVLSKGGCVFKRHEINPDGRNLASDVFDVDSKTLWQIRGKVNPNFHFKRCQVIFD